MDLMGGKCVRLVQGDFGARLEYLHDPVELAKEFMDSGLSLIHVVDLEGAREGRPANLRTVESVAAVGIEIQLGGGLRTANDIRQAVNSGARKIILGSSLQKSEDSLRDWLTGLPGIFLAGVDVQDGRVAVHGWKTTTAESAQALVSRVEATGRFHAVIHTDISRDGTLKGPDVHRLRRFAQTTSLPIFASGGIGSIDDILTIKRLENAGIGGVIVGRAFYEGTITLEEMTRC